ELAREGNGDDLDTPARSWRSMLVQPNDTRIDLEEQPTFPDFHLKKRNCAAQPRCPKIVVTSIETQPAGASPPAIVTLSSSVALVAANTTNDQVSFSRVEGTQVVLTSSSPITGGVDSLAWDTRGTVFGSGDRNGYVFQLDTSGHVLQASYGDKRMVDL